jgi:hypothetical protein
VDQNFNWLLILGFGFHLSFDDVFSSRIRGYICLDDFALVIKG